MNKRYTVAHVRERLSDALDEAERGERVIIERRGVRYQLSLASTSVRRTSRKKPSIEVLDPAVGDGEWSWDWTAKGLKFRARRKR
jgi:antitoxin (DNA-binding transcriptional repressor) of toxin-antitoxin stability system